jgi:AraC-like DNA-binding protein
MILGSEETMACATQSLASAGIIEQLFDHIPDTVFFLKDVSGRYVAVNQSLVERCGLSDKKQLIGKRVHDVFPPRSPNATPRRMPRSRARAARLSIGSNCTGTRVAARAGVSQPSSLCVTSAEASLAASASRAIYAPPGDRDSIPPTLASTLEFLETHYGENISPSALAQRTRLSSVRFARLIKRIFRLTPTQLITQTRLAAASRLLTETEHHVVEIAHTCGFYDHSAFTRAFRSATGMTPTQFRAARQRAT